MDTQPIPEISARPTRPREQKPKSDTNKQASRNPLHMLGDRELRVLQYNVQRSRDVVLASLFRDSRVLEYDILAMQEPWRNPFISTSSHPLKTHFQLIYPDDDATWVCFYINKRIDPSIWTVSHLSKDISSLTIRNPPSGTKIHLFEAIYADL